MLRFARFPTIAELYDISVELQHQAQIKANSEWISKMREDWSGHQVAEEGDGSACPGLRALK